MLHDFPRVAYVCRLAAILITAGVVESGKKNRVPVHTVDVLYLEGELKRKER